MIPQVIEIESMNSYAEIVDRVRRSGDLRSPRGLRTRDLGHTTIIMPCTGGFMPIGQGRGLNPAIGAVEAIQLIAGQSYPELVLKVAPQFEKYLDRGAFHGAYGTRIGYQVQAVIGKLRQDSSTRQAVITLWDPWLDNLHGMKDYPCTTALRFSINDNKLDLDVLMRSNDVWLGLPHDVFQFTQLQYTVATSLHLVPGDYRHTAWSLHLYESNFEAAKKFIEEWCHTPSTILQPTGFGTPGLPFTIIMQRAQAIARNATMLDAMWTNSEQWYRKVLHATNMG